MRETQMLISQLGMTPRPSQESGLCAPAVHGDKGAWVYDGEYDGMVPMKKGSEQLSHRYQPKKTI